MRPAPETKATCDANGKWTTVQVVRIRSGDGWIETIIRPPAAHETRKAAA